MAAVCTTCGERPRAKGARATECQPCKSERQREYRRTKGILPRTRSLHERLYEHVIVLANGCQVWTARLNDGGYGYLGRGGRGGKKVLAHVAAWELLRGPVPEGLELDHLCFERRCVNVDHLDAVPHEVNVQRARERALADRNGMCPHGHPYDSIRWDKVRGKHYPRCLTCAREENRRVREG